MIILIRYTSLSYSMSYYIILPFGTAKELSGKFTKLFSLSSEQLSKQE